MEEYGLIGGSTANMMSNEVNKVLTKGSILGIASWSGINHFRDGLRENRDNLRGLDKIMVIDTAFLDKGESMSNHSTARRVLNDFLSLETLVRRDLKGVFLILYTKSPVLDDLVKKHYKRDSLTKYERTYYILATEGYRATGMANILETTYVIEGERLGTSGTYHQEQEIERKVREQAEMYKLIGRYEELKQQSEAINKKLSLVNMQLHSILMGDRSDDLDVVEELVENEGVSKSLMDEIESLLNE